MNINMLMLGIEVTENFVKKLKQFKWSLIVKFDKRKVAHEWWAVKTVNNLLDVCGREIWSFRKHFLCPNGISKNTTSFYKIKE